MTQEAEEAYARLTTLLKYDLPIKVPLILVARNGSRDDVAVQNLLRRSGPPGRPSIVISQDDTRSNAIVHELAHIFTSEILPNVNSRASWLMEGFAEHAWGAAELANVRRAIQSNSIPAVTAMTDVHWGHALFDYVVERSNEEGCAGSFSR